MLTRSVLRLVSLALLWVFTLLFAAAVTATTPVPPPVPGTSFETARSLGLTTTWQTGPVGIFLTTNDDLGYYFYLAPDSDFSLTFTFYTYQPVSDYESRLRSPVDLLEVYSVSNRSRISSKPKLSCTLSYTSPSRKACISTLVSSLKGGQKYYLFVNFHTFDDATEGRIDAKDYEGWLTWKAPYLHGTSASQAWPWFDRDTLRGQIDVKGEHWYLVNASPGSRLEFSLWGSSYLDLCVYRADDPVKPLGCATKTTYPKVTSPVTAPLDILGQGKLLVKITNQDVRNIEYYLNYTRK